MDLGSLKRKESTANLDTSTSPTKKQAVHRQKELLQPSTKLCSSGEPVWRNQGIEGTDLEKRLHLYHTSNQVKGLTTDPTEITKEFLENLRVSEPYWCIYTHLKFAATYRKYAKRIRASFDLEADKAGQRSKFFYFKFGAFIFE